MISDMSLGKQVLEIIETLNEAAIQLHDMIVEQKEEASQLIQLMFDSMESLKRPIKKLYMEEPAIMSHLMLKNLEYSFLNLQIFIHESPAKACDKLRFEFIPLVQELYVDMYFWGFCYPDEKNMDNYYKNEMPYLCPLPYTEDSLSGAKSRYELSVVVVAYNKLDYTKMCLNHLREYLPQNINHEIILINNGSNDGTKEFFESCNPDKQIDIHSNTKSFSFLSRIVEGKYILFVSNDILVTPNAIENMMKCMQSDESIGCVVPACPNTSNIQDIPSNYGTIDEMIIFSEMNNKSDSSRWEQRARLIPPIVLARSSTEGIHAFFGYRYPFFPERFLAFTDDMMSLLMRRQGYKCILAKDAYVYHFGSITIREQTNAQEQFYLDGRMAFYRVFGIDPWHHSNCFDSVLVSNISYEQCGPLNILGVNCGFGSNPLKIKSLIQESRYNEDIKVTNVTNELMIHQQLEGVSDQVYFLQEWSEMGEVISKSFFNYIVVENFDIKNINLVLEPLCEQLKLNGVMAIRCQEIELLVFLKRVFNDFKLAGEWVIVHKQE